MSIQKKALRKERNKLVRAFDRLEAKEKLTPNEEKALAEYETRIQHLDTVALDTQYRNFKANGSVKVKSEPRVYGKGSKHSFVLDRCRVTAANAWGETGAYDAAARLHRHGWEMAREAAYGTRAGRRVEAELRDRNRGHSPASGDGTAEQRKVITDFREYGRSQMPEFRGPMSTSPGAGGELSTPIFLTSKAITFRQAGRATADVFSRQPLPDWGMAVYIPKFVTAPAVAQQLSQNSGIQETDPTTEFLEVPLITTQAGQITVSQQLIDRAGPGWTFDEYVFAALYRAYNPVVDLQCLNAAIAVGNAVTYTAAEFVLYSNSSYDGFVNEIGHAKTNMRTGTGTFLEPDTLIVQPGRLELVTSTTDTLGRPLVVRGEQGPNNSAGTALRAYGVEGPAGVDLGGLPVVTDSNIPVTSSGSYEQALVLDSEACWLWETTPTTRTVPELLANDLSVVFQLYSYTAQLITYPLGVQVISGTGLGTSISW